MFTQADGEIFDLLVTRRCWSCRRCTEDRRMILRSTLLAALLFSICAQAALAQPTPESNGTNVTLQYTAAVEYEACGHTWPPGAKACAAFTAAGDAEQDVYQARRRANSDH